MPLCKNVDCKGQKKSKWFFKPTFPPKNEQTNSTLLLWNLRLTCFRSFFLRKLKTAKRHFEIIWPLIQIQWFLSSYTYLSSCCIFSSLMMIIPKKDKVAIYIFKLKMIIKFQSLTISYDLHIIIVMLVLL